MRPSPPTSAPAPDHLGRRILLGLAGVAAVAFVIVLLAIGGIAFYRARLAPHRLTVSPARIAPGGTITVNGAGWGDIPDDGTGKHVDLSVVLAFCTDPYPPCSAEQQVRAAVAADGTFTATFAPSRTGSNQRLHVAGPDRNGPHALTTFTVDGP